MNDTITDIDEMKASRNLDALIAEKVMGFVFADKVDGLTAHLLRPESVREHYDVLKERPDKIICIYGVPDYSTEVEAAWEIIIEINKSFQLVRVDERYSCYFYEPHPKGPGRIYDYPKDKIWSYGNTASLTICRAALKFHNAQYEKA